MRIVRAASFLALIAATPAFAGDLPTKAPAGAAAPLSWTGCYMGAHAGGALGENQVADASGRPTDFNSTGFVGGGQIGCDYQFESGWVVGGEGRVAGTTLKSGLNTKSENAATGESFATRITFKNDVLASITARVGYRFADRWLGYVRGGGAVTHEVVDNSFTTAAGLTPDPTGYLTRTGWTVGTGVDWAFASNWSANIEYNYYDFGTTSMTLKDQFSMENVNGLKNAIHAVTTGVNYHF